MKQSRVQLLVSRLPLRPATPPRLTYLPEDGLASDSFLPPLCHLARHHTQVSSAALRRPESENHVNTDKKNGYKKRTNIVQNILSEARSRILRRMSVYPQTRHACSHNRWGNYPQVLARASL